MAREPANAVPQLSRYKGIDVLSTGIAITNAGDGLSKALDVDPEEFPINSTVYVVLECQVAKHIHLPVKDSNGLRLTQVFKAGNATIIDADAVKAAIDETARKIEAAAGVLRLPLDEDDGEPGEDGDGFPGGDVIDPGAWDQATGDPGK